MKHLKFFFISLTFFFIQNVYSQYYGQDIWLGNNIDGQRFILHGRGLFNSDFLQLTADNNRGAWMWNEGITFLRSNGNVGIGTTNPTDKFTVRGGVHLQEINNSNLRFSMGYYKSDFVEYSFLNSLDFGTNPPIGKNLVLNSRASNEAWGNVGIGPLVPIQALDIGGRLNVRKGVIQNYDSENPILVNGTEDLGLYSTISQRHIRIVTNQAPIQFFTDGTYSPTGLEIPAMYIKPDGSVGIGTIPPNSNYKLSVNGKLRAKEIRVESTWPDFVFNSDYKLLSLSEVESFIKEKGHLPEIPSEQEVTENGVELGDMTSKLLQKIEELTLHMIEQNKRIEKLEEENNQLKKTDK